MSWRLDVQEYREAVRFGPSERLSHSLDTRREGGGRLGFCRQLPPSCRGWGAWKEMMGLILLELPVRGRCRDGGSERSSVICLFIHSVLFINPELAEGIV